MSKVELTYTRLLEANGWLFEMFYDRHTKQGYFTAQHGNDEPFYLACLCARCHLANDLQHHVMNRSRTLREQRLKRIKEAGQLSLWSEE